jgi:hypothetical protein
MKVNIPGQTFQVVGGTINNQTHAVATGGAAGTMVQPHPRQSSNNSPTTKLQIDNSAFQYAQLAHAFNNIRPQPTGGEQSTVNQSTSPSPDTTTILTDDLQLTTKIQIITPFLPKHSTTNIRPWSFDEEHSDRITTFELDSILSTPECRYALDQLMMMVEDDYCERFYILDEVGNTAAVVCGSRTAFWSGTTAVLRQELTKRGIEFTIPLAKSNEVEAEKLRELRIGGDVGPLAKSTMADEKTCTLYFDSTFAVRGLIEAWINIIRKDAQVKILASQPFPGCAVKVTREKVTPRITKSKTQWMTEFTGFFNILDIDKVVKAFGQNNGGASDAKFMFEKSHLTREFDQVAQEILKYPSMEIVDARDVPRYGEQRHDEDELEEEL